MLCGFWQTLALSECQPSRAYSPGSGPFQDGCQPVLVQVRGRQLHKWVAGSLPQGCWEAWAATDSIPCRCPAGRGRDSTSRAEEAGTLGASACCLPRPECPGLGVVCSKALWAPREHVSVCIDSGGLQLSRVDACCDGCGGGLLLSDSDLSAPLFCSRGRWAEEGVGWTGSRGRWLWAQEPRPLGRFLLCQGIASRLVSTRARSGDSGSSPELGSLLSGRGGPPGRVCMAAPCSGITFRHVPGGRETGPARPPRTAVSRRRQVPLAESPPTGCQGLSQHLCPRWAAGPVLG